MHGHDHEAQGLGHAGAQVARGLLEPGIEGGECRRHGDHDVGEPRDHVHEHDAREGVQQVQVDPHAVKAQRVHDRRHDDGHQHQRPHALGEAGADAPAPHRAQRAEHDAADGGGDGDDDALPHGIQPHLVRQEVRVVLERQPVLGERQVPPVGEGHGRDHEHGRHQEGQHHPRAGEEDAVAETPPPLHHRAAPGLTRSRRAGAGSRSAT